MIFAHLDRKENRSDLQGRTPLVFENIKADPSQLVNVRMVDTSDESHLKQLRLSQVKR